MEPNARPRPETSDRQTAKRFGLGISSASDIGSARLSQKALPPVKDIFDVKPRALLLTMFPLQVASDLVKRSVQRQPAMTKLEVAHLSCRTLFAMREAAGSSLSSSACWPCAPGEARHAGARPCGAARAAFSTFQRAQFPQVSSGARRQARESDVGAIHVVWIVPRDCSAGLVLTGTVVGWLARHSGQRRTEACCLQPDGHGSQVYLRVRTTRSVHPPRPRRACQCPVAVAASLTESANPY